MLTEAETEYSVKCTKHIVGQHVVFEFRITNTLNDQVLENVRVALEGGEQEVDADEVIVVPAPKATYDVPTYAYVAFPADVSIASQTFEARLDFVVKDCDPETGECDEEGYDDNYAVRFKEGSTACQWRAKCFCTCSIIWQNTRISAPT
jgi:coatomer protein complex subunit gamma